MLRKLYASQLRVARYYDANPFLKSMLVSYGPTAVQPPSLEGLPPAASYIHQQVQRVFQEFTDSCSTISPHSTSLTDFVRNKYRDAEMRSLDLNEGSNIAYNTQRVLEAVAKITAELASDEDNRCPPLEHLPVLVEEAESISPGCLMVQGPCAPAPGRAVTFIYDIAKNVQDVHGDEDWAMRGYFVNRPLPMSVGKLLKRDDLGPFGDLTIFYGGDQPTGVAVIHKIPDLDGAVAVNPDDPDTFYIGGNIEEINRRLREGLVKAEEFKVFSGSFCLKLEVDEQGEMSIPGQDDCWFVKGAGAAAVVMQPALFDTVGKFRDGRGLGPDDVIEGYNYARFWHQNAVWQHIVSGMAHAKRDAGDVETAQALEDLARLHPALVYTVQGSLGLPFRMAEFAVAPDASTVAEEQA